MSWQWRQDGKEDALCCEQDDPITLGYIGRLGCLWGHCAPVRQILVEQQLHAGRLITRPSRSAVKALLEAHQMFKTRFGAHHERTIEGDPCSRRPLRRVGQADQGRRVAREAARRSELERPGRLTVPRGPSTVQLRTRPPVDEQGEKVGCADGAVGRRSRVGPPGWLHQAASTASRSKMPTLPSARESPDGRDPDSPAADSHPALREAP